MTSNQVAYKEAKTREKTLEETKRSNRAQEWIKRDDQKIAKRGQNTKLAGDIIKSVTNVATSAAKANDPSWYNSEPQLVKDVASISFNAPLGNTVSTMFDPVTGGDKGVVPGIMVLRFMPTIGALSKDGKASTADIAAKSLYSYVRYANSGARNYEASDLMMYLLATGQAYSYYAYLTKVYSLLTTSKSDNRYYVNAMLCACGVDPDNLRNNIANFRAYINNYATRLNSLYIPKDLPFITRHVWMNTGIFKDSEIKKSQEYMFLQRDFLAYDDKNGLLCVFPEGIEESSYSNYAHNFQASSRFTFNQLKNTGDLLINQLIQSEDAGIMGGDILKAYGADKMAYASIIPEDYHIESLYSLEVLSQIHNALFAGIPTTGLNAKDKLHLFDISQTTINDVDFLTQGKPYYATHEDAIANTNIKGFGFPTTMGLTQPHWVSTPVDTENSILNFYKDSPTPDDVMVATRLQFVVNDDGYFSVGDGMASIKTGCLTDFGTEICIDYSVFFLEATGEVGYYADICSILDDLTDIQMLNRLTTICTFDWHPRTISYGEQGVSNHFGFSNMANYAILSNQEKINMHYVAVLSEFGIPKLGLTVRSR